MRAARASRSSYSEPDAFVIINSKILSKTCLIIVINKRSKDIVIKKEGKKKNFVTCSVLTASPKVSQRECGCPKI